MTRALQSLLVLTFVVSLCSFRSAPEIEYVGTYGACGEDPSGIELVINDDHTFTYRDLSNPNRKIEVSGAWTEKGNHIILKDDNQSTNFHRRWKIGQDGMVAKSRRGLNFYTLRRQ